VVEILAFELAGQRYGLYVDDVQEIVNAVTIVPLPKAPAIVEGIINLRGEVVSALDIRSRFRLPAQPPRHTDHLIVARLEDRRFALRVDRAVDVIAVARGEVEDGREAIPGSEYVAGILKLHDGLILIHDLRTFLSAEEATALDEALHANTAGAQAT
jgi:purine-binding chemotaxis protein CheW